MSPRMGRSDQSTFAKMIGKGWVLLPEEEMDRKSLLREGRAAKGVGCASEHRGACGRGGEEG